MVQRDLQPETNDSLSILVGEMGFAAPASEQALQEVNGDLVLALDILTRTHTSKAATKRAGRAAQSVSSETETSRNTKRERRKRRKMETGSSEAEQEDPLNSARRRKFLATRVPLAAANQQSGVHVIEGQPTQCERAEVKECGTLPPTRARPERKTGGPSKGNRTQSSLVAFLHRKPAPAPQRTSPVDKIEDEVDAPTRANSSHSRQRSSSANVPSNIQMWIDKYKPKSAEDLAVHKSIIEKVRCWIRDSSATSAKQKRSIPSVLVLSGPTGSGKTALVRVLAAEGQLGLAEWQSPNGNAKGWEGGNFTLRHRQDTTYPSYESSLDSLEHFLLGAAKYRALPMVTADQLVVPNASALIMVDELPHLSNQDQKERFHNIVSRFSAITRTPAIFVMSTHRSVQSTGSGRQSSDETRAQMYFTPEFIDGQRACEIKCPEANKTNLAKLLRGILALERQMQPGIGKNSECDLKTIVVKAKGDIRCAINILQFATVGPNNQTARRGESHPINRSDKPKSKDMFAEQAIPMHISTEGRKDVQLDMFRALGKILYNKRVQEPAAGSNEIEPTPSPQLKPEYVRQQSKEDPEELIGRYGVDGDQLADQLQQVIIPCALRSTCCRISQGFSCALNTRGVVVLWPPTSCAAQNYPDFFSLIEEAAVVAGGFSNSDLIAGWRNDSAARTLGTQLAVSLAVRTVSFANTAPTANEFRAFRYRSRYQDEIVTKDNWRGADRFIRENALVGGADAISHQASVAEVLGCARQTRMDIANFMRCIQQAGPPQPQPEHMDFGNMVDVIDDH
jgi:DNA polymerase III delta prime subunit